MIFLALSAAMIGFVHSLIPSHWLPVVVMSKSRKWALHQTVAGAITLASGHILVSLGLGIAAIWAGAQIFAGSHQEIERAGGFMLIGFGVIYSALAYHRHVGCHGHEHHGPEDAEIRQSRAPYVLLFTVGLAPCFAVLPVFLAAAVEGPIGIMIAMGSFVTGVLTSVIGSTLLVSKGLLNIDHPLIEHYGDVIAGLVVALMGIALLMLPEHHHHLY